MALKSPSNQKCRYYSQHESCSSSSYSSSLFKYCCFNECCKKTNHNLIQQFEKNKELSYSENSPNQIISLKESTENFILHQSSSWCTLAYWEFRSRVGRLFPVSDEIIEVFNDSPKSNGLCLRYLPTSDENNSAKIKKIKQKIGLGIRIKKEDNSVLIFNRSNYPIFLNSSTLEPLNSRKLTVFKLLPGYSIKAFDFEVAMKYLAHPQFEEPLDGPFDINSIRISFVKGWGPSFSRQYITSCPCWLEIIFMIST